LPSLTDKLEAKKADIEKWGLDDLLDIGDEEHFGLSGSPTGVVNIEVPEEKGRESKIFEGPNSVKKLIGEIKSDIGGI